MTPASAPTTVVSCPSCDGAGTVPERVDPAVWAEDVECTRCDGIGLIDVEACDVCRIQPALDDSECCAECLEQRRKVEANRKWVAELRPIGKELDS